MAERTSRPAFYIVLLLTLAAVVATFGCCTRRTTVYVEPARIEHVN